MRAFTLAILCLIPISIYASARSTSGGLAERVAELEAEVAELSAVLQFVYIEEEEINGVAGPHWIIEGANVHVRSGSGETSDGCPFIPAEPGLCQSLTGLGNLIVGYNERRGKSSGPIRAGSHNLRVGDHHAYWSFGGFVAGGTNHISGPKASVCGGVSNRASGFASSVCGGEGNFAIGVKSSVSGGQGNEAIGYSSSVSGGQFRSAENDFNWAAGSLFEEN